VLVGMDFGNSIGKYSKEKVQDPEIKKQKMQAGKRYSRHGLCCARRSGVVLSVIHSCGHTMGCSNGDCV
jgi:uncharacterized Rossmann fold enzyme